MKNTLIALFALMFCASLLAATIEEAQTFFEEGKRLQAAGKFEDAIVALQKGIEIYESESGFDEFELSVELDRLGNLYAEMGQYENAEAAFQRAFSIRKKIRGDDHPDTAGILNDLAMLYETMGRLEEAEASYLKALDIREQGLGADHYEVSLTLNSLAWFYYYTGRYFESESIYRRTLAIREKHLGPDHTDVATVLNNFGVLLNEMGRYDEAEFVLKRALTIRKNGLDQDHPYIGTSLNNLALVYRSTGRFEEAIPLYRQTLAVMEKAYGAEHPNIGTVLTNLGRIYFLRNDFPEAETMLKRALAIREKALGPDHSQVSFTTDLLTALYLSKKEYDHAEFYLKRTSEIRKKTLGEDHPAAASVLIKEALLARNRKDTGRAQRLYKQAIVIREKTAGQYHPDHSVPLTGIAFTSAISGNHSEASEFFQRAIDINSQTRETAFSLLSDRQKLSFLKLQEPDLHAYISHTLQFKNLDPAALEKTMDTWLLWKGSVLEAQNRYQQALLLTEDETFRQKWKALQNTRRELARLWIRGQEKKTADEYRKQVQELDQRKQDLEAELSRISAAFKQDDQMRKVTAKTLRQMLPDQSVYLDFAVYRSYNFTEDQPDDLHYASFLLTPNSETPIKTIDLGKAEPIDQAVKDLLALIRENASIPARTRMARRLHQMLFSKLGPLLKDRKQLFVSPDGALHLLPFEVLIGPDGKSMLEKFELSYITSGKDVLRWRKPDKSGHGALIMADPSISFESAKNEGGEVAAQLRNSNLGRLPGARREAEAIKSILSSTNNNPVEIYFDMEAAENRLIASAAEKKILHLAVHGFFLDPGEPFNIPGSRFSFLSGWAPEAAPANPMLRSGILLAPSSNNTASASEDGILSAEEMIGLNLHGADLVVLSACDTARGEIRRGEGVLGLQRSLILAGADSLVMSLWQVSDKATESLMSRFYELWTSGMSKSKALRKAKLDLSATQPDPFFWGAFILIGNPD